MHALARSRQPWLRNALIGGVLRAYPQIDLGEAADPDPYAYPSFNAFFTRELRAGVRPLAGGERDLVSPVDGTLSQLGRVRDGQLLQAKGVHYTAGALLADEAAGRRYDGGGFACIYLAPYNYHRIHMPLAGRLTATRYVPGQLYSVNAATARAVPGLFARNERVVCEFDTDLGPLAVVMVGALFVGSIETVFAGEINPPGQRGGVVRSIDAGPRHRICPRRRTRPFQHGLDGDRAARQWRHAVRRAARSRQHAAPRPGARRHGMNQPAPGSWRPTAALDTLRLRARLLGVVRSHFQRTGALEVETPVLVRAAVTDVHLESLEVRRSDGSRVGFLHTSPEYAMKRLLCAGAPDMFQVAHVFREGERGRRHNPEFTMVEWYRLGIDHHALMQDVEALLRALLEPLRPVGPTVHVTYARSIRRGAAASTRSRPRRPSIAAALRSAAIDLPAGLEHDRDGLLDLGLSTVVTAGFADDRITFMRDFPASQAALARTSGAVAARFEAFWGDLELANGFHELGDRDEQARRFAGRRDRASRARPACA